MKKSMTKNIHKNKKVQNVANLFFCIMAVLAFIFYIGPLMEKLSWIQPFIQCIDERNIDASTLYYTESEEFSGAELHMENTMEYMPSGNDKQK